VNEQKRIEAGSGLGPRSGEDQYTGYSNVFEPPGAPKMSEVVLEFLEPYKGLWDTAESLRKLLSLATVAWNGCLMAPEERDSFLHKMRRLIPDGLQPLLAELMVRKVTHFHQHDRYILDFNLTESEAGLHLLMSSTFQPPHR
jgi:hypothetical protein